MILNEIDPANYNFLRFHFEV